MMIGLGATVVKVVDSPGKCPPGTYAEQALSDILWNAFTFSNKAVYECRVGEPWYCDWFGIGCKGVPALPPAAPRTESQMRNPLEWTPEISVSETRREQERITSAWMQTTEGVARFPSWVENAGENVADAIEGVKEAATSGALWFIVGAAAVVAVIVMAKRV